MNDLQSFIVTNTPKQQQQQQHKKENGLAVNENITSCVVKIVLLVV